MAYREMSIELGEDFSAFPEGFNAGWGFEKPEDYTTAINSLVLKIPLLDIPFRYSLRAAIENWYGAGFTPFNPESGYIVTEEDFTPEKREEKLSRIYSSWEDLTFWGHTYPQAPYQVNAASKNPHRNAALYKDNGDFKEAVKDILSRIALQLHFPRNAFESRAEFTGYRINHDHFVTDDREVCYNDFYPLDIGPLTTFSDRNPLAPKFGEHGIYIPRIGIDQIRSKFVLINQ